MSRNPGRDSTGSKDTIRRNLYHREHYMYFRFIETYLAPRPSCSPTPILPATCPRGTPLLTSQPLKAPNNSKTLSSYFERNIIFNLSSTRVSLVWNEVRGKFKGGLRMPPALSCGWSRGKLSESVLIRTSQGLTQAISWKGKKPKQSRLYLSSISMLASSFSSELKYLCNLC